MLNWKKVSFVSFVYASFKVYVFSSSVVVIVYAYKMYINSEAYLLSLLVMVVSTSIFVITSVAWCNAQ